MSVVQRETSVGTKRLKGVKEKGRGLATGCGGIFSDWSGVRNVREYGEVRRLHQGMVEVQMVKFLSE